jgi:lipopolysaccharide transport system ATP-binding protein
MSYAIRIENVGKKYLIAHQQRERYTALRDSLAGVFKNMLCAISGRRGASGSGRVEREVFWALKDIGFEVASGERVGIIGRNGAGKSTLLKVLSRITEPTIGRVSIRGRVASLLEVGTGFHPELTGRENIFLNGAILGMTKREIRRKFDDIVAFSEVEKFLDTPVKRYSSGMYVRLAFAVAAHLEPEILIVDEVLAVGDAAFQKKCLGKMGEVSSEGRTVLFVSHNMSAVRQLCGKAILLDGGRVQEIGTSEEVCSRYLKGQSDALHRMGVQEQIRCFRTDPLFRLDNIEITQDGNPVSGPCVNGTPVEVRISYELLEEVAGLRVFVDVLDEYGDLLFRTFHDDQAQTIPTMHSGKYRSELTIPEDFLAPRMFTLCVKAGIYRKRYTIPEEGVKIPLQIEHTSEYNRAYPGDPISGKLCPLLDWRVTRIL